jgi:cysteine protease ATG4
MVWSFGDSQLYSVSHVMPLDHLTRANQSRALVHQHGQTKLRVYVTGDGSDVYEDSVFKVAKSEDGQFHPTLLLINIRLGINGITPVYWESLKASLQMPQSMGIAG